MTGTILEQFLGLPEQLTRAVNNPAGVNEMLAHVDKIVNNPNTPHLKKRMAGVLGEVLHEAKRQNAAPRHPLDDLVNRANAAPDRQVIRFGDIKFFILQDTDSVSVIKVRVMNHNENEAAVCTESGHSYFVPVNKLYNSQQEAWHHSDD